MLSVAIFLCHLKDVIRRQKHFFLKRQPLFFLEFYFRYFSVNFDVLESGFELVDFNYLC